MLKRNEQKKGEVFCFCFIFHTLEMSLVDLTGLSFRNLISSLKIHEMSWNSNTSIPFPFFELKLLIKGKTIE